LKTTEFNEETWRLQREREEAAKRRGASRLARLKQYFSVTRYQVTLDLVRSIRPAGGAFIDVGCGRGEIIEMLLPHFDRLVGIDATIGEMERFCLGLADEAKRKVEIQAVDLDGEWNLPDSSFDVVTCLAVLEHLIDPYGAASELTRIAKRGGILVIEVPNIAYVKYRLSLLAGTFPATSGSTAHWDGGHLHYFTQKSLTGLFAKYGCTVKAASGSGFLGKWRSQRPSLLCGDCVVAFEKT
jgi:2-polyprenyl-3-methyl-5-hydroxy-6-metoxy-1,4-benzoquinol methylase